MRQTWNVSAYFSGICLILLIFDSSAAVDGARQGLELCMKTVIPSLFPFIVISMLLTGSAGTGGRWGRYIANWLGIPETASCVVIPAFLGGYPVGAKCIHDLYQKEHLEKEKAEHLLAFCSNAGPSFLFGMVAGFFPNQSMVWLLWLIHVTSALMTAVVFKTTVKKPGSIREDPKKAEDILFSAMKAMGLICCWVILFRILVNFLKTWCLWLLPQWLQILVTGMLELTNGCCELPVIESVKLRFVLCSCMLAFGGVCILMQTVSVTKGLSLRFYILGKAMQTLFSLLMSCAVTLEHGWIAALSIPLILYLFRKIQKSCGNMSPVPV